MERPRLRFRYSPRLAARALIHFERTGKFLPPEEVASLPDDDWEQDVFVTARQWLQFHRDWHKLPKGWAD